MRELQIRRGLKSAMPSLAEGEPGFCTDTLEFFIGTASGVNQKISTVYVPAVAANWANPKPTSLSEAIDRLAAAVATLSGGPIA